jgi:hypothetical protein
MKRRCSILLLAMALGNPAWANIRPPLKADGFFSGSLRSLPVSGAIKLLGEDLRFVFPDLRRGISENGAWVRITVRYDIFNGLAGEMDVPVHFLAVDIQALEASLDGRPLPVEVAPDPTEKSECLWRLARHRSAFQGSFYRDYLRRLRNAAGLNEVPDAEWLGALEGKDLGGIGPRELYPDGRWGTEAADFRSAGIRLHLRPGINTLQIAYAQRMFIDERDYGYAAGWPKKGFSGVDYLLYPATSWTLDPGFRLRVSAEIPEMRSKRPLGKAWRKPDFRTSLKMAEAESERPHVRLIRGEFAGIPTDILSILIWYDAKASRHISE